MLAPFALEALEVDYWHTREFDFRFSTRKISDTERFAQIVDRTDGIRLSYRPLAAA